MNLLETQRTSKLNIDSLKFNVNDIVLVFYEKVPRHFWRVAIILLYIMTLYIMILLPSRESEIRGAIVRIAKSNAILKCPVNEPFAIENTYHGTNKNR